MPELPEVEALTAALSDRMVGRRIDRYQLTSFSALKTVTPGLDDLVGRTIASVRRQGKFVCIDTRDSPPGRSDDGGGGKGGGGEGGHRWLVVHLALGGWIAWYETLPSTTLRPQKSPIALRAALDDGSGFDITEMGTEKRLALWVAHSLTDIEPVGALGIDPLGSDFTTDRLAELLAGTSSNLKTALTTQSLIAGVGNAYSDEALHRAHLSPYKKTSQLTGSEVERLHSAVIDVLTEAVERSSGLDPRELKGDKKRSMAVHGRTGEPCPECGDTIRQVSFASKSLQYCPSCQTGGRTLADRRLSRLLK